MGVVAKRFDIHLVDLDPTLGAEIQKTRPCVIISPDEMNDYIQTVIIAPITSKERDYPTRISCIIQNRQGYIVLDQIRTIDKHRLIKKIGVIDESTQRQVLEILAEIFAP